MSREVDRTARVFLSRPSEGRSDLRSYLIVLQGARAGEALTVGGERTVLGRRETAALRLADPGVSSRHCELWLDGRTIWVEDLGSSNGTFVDDRPAAGPTPVPVGSTLRVGKTLLRHELRNPEELARGREVADDLARAAGYVASILPPPIDDGPVRVEWRFVPSAEVGGDAFGYRWLDADRFALFLLDVSGHGTAAALHSVAAVNALRHGIACADPGLPATVLAGLNAAFPMEAHGGLYLTAWYGVFDRRDRRLEFASAGHPPPLLRSPSAAAPEPLRLRQPPIGLAPGVAYRSDARVLAPGSRLYLFSDGVFELRTSEGEERGFDELAAVVGRPAVAGLAESTRVEIDVRAAMAGRLYEDDFSLVVATFD